MRRFVAGIILGTVLVVSGCGGGGEGGSFCDQARALSVKFDALNEGDFSYATFAGILSDLKKVDPPPEIEADYNTLVSGLEDFVRALEPLKDADFADPSSFDVTDPEVAAALEELTAIGENTEFTTAGDNVDAFLESECGIQTDSTG